MPKSSGRSRSLPINFIRALLPAALIAELAAGHSAFAATNPYALSQQDVLNGASSVAANANYGKGIVFGDIDTGVTSQWVGFTASYNGQGVSNIDTKDSAVCITKCPTGAAPVDGNGHGTFTASEMVGGAPGSGLGSMAAGASLIAVQVLNAAGSGTSTDVANGIVYAVNHGAQILNLSLGPSGTGAQEAAFYESLASAINYAASKNVTVVFAGGNSSQAFVGGTVITGFTTAAIQHMLFMGSTNAGEKLSSFSNTPGSGYFLSTTGQKVNYDSMWMMADGENIWGASNYYTPQYGYSYITQMSGTSMAAPQGAGAAGLLDAKWPVLIKNGTTLQVLEATGQFLGTNGVNTTYGEGFINLVQAFQPVGALSVTTTAGKSIAVSQLTSSMITGGALGSLSSISSQLGNYTAFDTFQRNFTVNLSSLISTKPSTSSVTQSVTAPAVVGSSTKFTDGSSMAFGTTDAPAAAASPDGAPRSSNWYMSMTDSSGSTFAAGNGFPATASFADALWGSGSVASFQASSLGVSSALADLAEGGAFAAYGMRLGGNMRMAFSYAQTQAIDAATPVNNWMAPDANAFSAGVTGAVAEGWKAGMTFSMLNEQNGLLGTTYSGASPLSFGSQNRSMSVGVSSAFDFGGDLGLLLDAAVARTDGASVSDSLISGVSPLYARSYGAALVQNDMIAPGDNLSLSLRAPLRVYSGYASVASTSVDDYGNATTATQRASLVPTGSEMDLTVGYQRPVDDDMSWNVSLAARHDPDNIAGTSDVGILVGGKLSF